MYRIFYPKGTTQAKEIFESIRGLESIPYETKELPFLKKEKMDLLVANTRLKIGESTFQEFPNVPVFATVSSGTDHVNFEDVQKFGKQFWNSPGSNATSVAEYVISCFLFFCPNPEERIQKSICIFGFGNIGKILYNGFQKQNFSVTVIDPFYPEFSKNTQEISEFDFLTIHVSLTKTGQYPTHGFLTEDFFQQLKKDAIFINSSRGEVIAKSGYETLRKREDLKVALDVFPNEPPKKDFYQNWLSRKNTIFTPHVAGYSQLGRVKGTYALAEKIQSEWGLEGLMDIVSYLDTSSEFSFPSFLSEESELLKSKWELGDDDYFESRRNQYPIRLDSSEDPFWACRNYGT